MKLTVASGTLVPGLASCIQKLLEDGEKQIVLQSVGAAALNQAVKAVCAVNQWHLRDGLPPVGFCPNFRDTVIEGREKTAVDIVLLRP